MADNIRLSAGTNDGAYVAGASLSFSGDTAVFQIFGGTILTGSEGSWTQTPIVGGTGAVTGGVQRVTLANDDTLTAAANAILTTIDTDTGNIATNTTDVPSVIGTDGSAGPTKALSVGGTESGGNLQEVRVDSDGHLQIDVLSGASGGTAYTEDVATANPIVGTATVMERDDVLAGLTPAEGDWAALRCSAEGALWVQDFNSDGILSDTAAMVVDLAAIEALLITIDADTSKITACNTGAVVISSGTVTTVSAVTAITNALPAGDNNIGNVDIVTLPAGNLGMKAMAASLSVVPASDITDGTYIGDIKFGEALVAGTALIGKVGVDQTTPGTTNAVAPISGQDGIAGGTGVDGATVPRVTLATDIPLPAGTNEIGKLAAGTAAIGKLAANTGVDIGDVDVTSIVPGTAATNLGKARASALGATDTGVAALAVRNDDLADLSGADGDYTPLQVNAEGALFVSQATAEVKQASGVAAGGAPGTDDMIAAVGGKKLLILAMSLFSTSATTNTVYVDNVDNDLLGNSGNGIALSLDADGDTVPGFILPYNPGGWFKTDTVNEAVTLNTSAAQDVVWCITYIETD